MISVIVFVLCGLCSTAVGDGAAIEVGIGGVYRTGSWTPVTVSYSGGSATPGAVRVWVEDPDGQPVGSPAAAVVATADGAAQACVSVRFGRPGGRIMLEALADPQTNGPFDASRSERRSLPPPIPSTESVFLVVGDMPAAERASRLLSREDGTRPRVVPIVTATDATRLPGPHARDFDGVDSIILCGRRAAGIDARVVKGIDAWVRQGGQLVLLAGASAVDVARAENAAAAWLPGGVSRLVPMRRGNAIETYARASRPLDKGIVAALQIPLFDAPDSIAGSVEAFEGRGPADLPLVVRRAHGFGTVVWAGIDLDDPALHNWSGGDTLLVEMLRGRRAARDAGRAGETDRAALDLAGQLRQAIDRFPGVAPIPFELVAGLGVLYVACLYPLDWWLVSGRRRGPPARRTWLAWLSLPVAVAAASGVAWSAGDRWKGRDWRTSAAELIDLDLESGLVRVAAYMGVWSPENAAVTLRCGLTEPAVGGSAAPVGDLSWFAASGRGIGGTDAAAAHPSLAARDYRYAGDLTQLDGIPVAASSSRLYEAHLVAQHAVPFASTLAREGQGTLRGSVTSRLPFPLEECVLVHAGWLYDIGPLAPGEAFEPGLTRGPRSLSGALTHRTMQKDREVAERWNLAESDPRRILEIAGLHAAAGGSGYTSLEPGRLGRFDMSPLLPLDRAVLVGRGPAVASWESRLSSLKGNGLVTALPPPAAGTSLWRIVIPLPPQSERFDRPTAAAKPSAGDIISRGPP